MCDSRLQHIEDAGYRGHEIVISQCTACNEFVVDARSDNFDGEFLAGYINPSIYDAIGKAQRAIDVHEFEKSLTVTVPF